MCRVAFAGGCVGASKDFMAIKCPASCGSCAATPATPVVPPTPVPPVVPPAATCVDLDAQCAAWKAAGMADTRVLAVLGVEHGMRAVLIVQANVLVPAKLT